MFKSFELNRKSIHLMSVIYPFIYIFFEKQATFFILLLMFIIVLAWDVARISNINLGILSFFKKFLRKKELEKNQFSGAFYFLLSSLIVVIMFPKHVAILSMFILIFCDTVASFVGIKYGKIKLLGKSVEGYFGFIISGFIIVSIYFFVMFTNYSSYLAALLAVIVAASLELASNKLRVDDNLLVTLGFAFSFYYLTIFLV